MDLSQFIADSAKGPIPIAELTTLAADRRCFGDDCLAAFTSQAQLRSGAAQTILDAATTANRDTLLASEQRSYDANIRERDSILGLQRQVEQRTESRSFVPQTQVVTGNTPSSDEIASVLSKEQRCVAWAKAKGGRYQSERGADSMKFGRVIRAFATGDKRGLSDLELRALAEGAGISGGYLVPEILGTQFIDRVRDASVCFRAGAQLVPMTSDKLHLARLQQPGMSVGSPGAEMWSLGWKAENDPIVEGQMELERVTFDSHTLALLVTMSVELSEDASNIDAVIEREMSQAAALELDRAALMGSGSGEEPTGILNQTNVDTGTIGGPISYDELIDACAVVAGKNHVVNARIYNSEAAATLAKLRGAVNGEYLVPPAYLAPVTPYVTNAMNFAGSPTSTQFVVGDFSMLMIGMRTAFRLEASRTAGDAFSNLQVHIRCYLRADVQLAHPEAFAWRT